MHPPRAGVTPLPAYKLALQPAVCRPSQRRVPLRWLLYPAVCLALANHGRGDELPEIPVGLDAVRQWDRWPVQRIGARAYMRSTYDRTGGNRDADASSFLYQLRDDFNVTLDLQSPGLLCFARYNHWHGSPWHYEVDGTDNIVSETSSANPDKPVKQSVFLPEKAFPAPLTFTWSTTRGADLSWVPIGFDRSFRMTYSRTHYGTGYYIYQQFVPGARLSRPLTAWTPSTEPDKEALALISRSGTDLLPAADTPEAKQLGLTEQSGKVAVAVGQSTLVARLDTAAPAMLRAIDLSVPREQAIDFGRARLRIMWDDRPMPSVDAPVALFFGAGTLYNRDDREFLVKAFPVHVRFDADRVHLACYFPMPYFKSARIELVGADSAISDVVWRVRWAPSREPAENLTYFHATYVDHGRPEPGRDLPLLDTRQTEGGGDWSGHFVGTSFIFSDTANLGTLEGDPRFFFDDSRSPQGQGTGTEEWGGGGDYWGGQTMALPFAGHPVGAPNPAAAKTAEDKIQSAYRFLLSDLMPFGRNARICLEHGGQNDSTDHYQTVTYWYGAPRPTLVETDTLKIGDAESERSHHYLSPDASAVYEINSRYELGVDHHAGQEIYPAETDRGRVTTGSSEMTLKIDPKNVGVMLRRKLDYAFANQRADVFLADVATGDNSAAGAPDWQPAGVWYLAGSNRCVRSNPKAETGATAHEVVTSNRQFRDDEFLLPRSLTAERSAIRVRVVFRPVEIPLFPGDPLGKLGWSEIRYSAYSFVAPAAPLP
ncbi:MAG TPA: DUF2961 domain-containing protein [Pirellulales bacterium]|nr:DUF2961 domain-containing protein [Pirellulales bacterium]